MVMTYYEIGRSGKGASLVCGSLDDVHGAARQLPPGRYWITLVEVREECHLGSVREAEDYGTLEVRGEADYTLTALGGDDLCAG